jgi:CTP:molybdopterin cytidylyltransferase MocA
LEPTAEAREVVHRHVARTEYVDVDDEGIFTDIDTPEAYRRLRGETVG